MSCPPLTELPCPPPGTSGWPWIDDTARLSACMPDGQPWPRITVVTPSFNQGEYVEETIRSVLLQGYPNLEYIVIDGGSTDGSVEIVKKYEPWLSYWVSEPDSGQAHAITKGLERATGEIFNFINSDDLLLPGTLHAVAGALVRHDAVAGNVVNFDEAGGEELFVQSGLIATRLIYPGAPFHQPGLWLRPHLIHACGGIDVGFRYVFDWDLAIRYLALFPDVAYLAKPLARFRLHSSSKTVAEGGGFLAEMPRVVAGFLEDEHFAPLADASRLFLRRDGWHRTLETFRNAPPAPLPIRLLRATLLSLLACRDPRIRFCRPTAGTARRTLTGAWEGDASG